MAEKRFDVVVIGAGIAGLAAARTLAEAGRRVILVEARQRIGGRICTVRTDNAVVELGAEFVHGCPPELWDLIEEAGLCTYERTGEVLHRAAGDGEFNPGDEEDGADPLEALKTFQGPDCSFLEYLDRGGLLPAERDRAIGYVEGFNAATAREVSAKALGTQQRAEDAIEGERSWRLVDGYDRLPLFLSQRFDAAGGTTVLGAAVDVVRWGAGSGVVIETVNGRSWSAAQAVVTLPLGVLQAGAVRLDPEAPAILEAAGRMRMGDVCRVTMVFSRQLWPAPMSFLMTPDLLPAVWWTAHGADRPRGSATLTGWLGGPRCLPLLQLTHGELTAIVIAGAALALGIAEEELRAALLSFHTHDWSADPFACGAYSWVPVGGLGASAALAEPVEGTLFFAGEHTDTTGLWGTVHAALGSGLRAARQLLGTAGS